MTHETDKIKEDHELEDLKQRLKEKEDKLDNEIKEIKDMLEPLLETYKVAITLGKWIMGLLVLFSVILGIVLSIKSIFK